MSETGKDSIFGDTRSLRGRTWSQIPADDRMSAAIQAACGLPEIACRIMASRGQTPESVADFLSPSLRNSLPDPSEFKDMDKAADHLAACIMDGRPVAVFGDYDVDGATSSAVLKRYFAGLGVDLGVYIPDRLNEGYGPNTDALMALKAEGIDTVITVDCGILSFVPLAAAAKAGLNVIVVDHHKAEPQLPDAVAVVNPNRLDEGESHDKYGHLAAVGVVFLLLVALNRTLKTHGYFESSYFANKPPPDLLQLLDLVALGTVCDVVGLYGLNRAFVTQGLKVMANRGNAGLRALADVARLDSAPGAYHLGFLLGPRVNAGGRVGESHLGAELLASDDEDFTRDVAARLDGYNADRQAIEARILDEAAQMAESAIGVNGAPGALVYVAGRGWHPGVIGIVASRLKEKFDRPTLVLADDGRLAKGSGRSISGVDLGTAVIEAGHQGLLVNGGGHAMAAGLTVESHKINALRAFLDDYLAPSVAQAQSGATTKLDGVMATGGASAELVDAVEHLGPFGAGNPTPRFAVLSARIVAANIVGENHIKLVLQGDDGARIKAIAFRAADDWGGALMAGEGKQFHFAGRLKLDDWRKDGSVEMVLDDALGPL